MRSPSVTGIRPRNRRRGFSLVELMVATALLAVATAGGLTAFSHALSARRAASDTQQQHERAQYVFATLEPELQMAGYLGNAAASAPLAATGIPEPALRCGADVVRRLALPLQVLPTWSLPCAASGGGAVDGSDVLVLRRASARLAPAPQAGRAQWLSRISGTADGALYWAGDAPWHAGVPGEELRELIVRIYYVARRADGDASAPALRVKSLTSIAGVPAFIDTEVMPGVEQLQVELLPSPAAPRLARLQIRVRADGAALRTGTAPGVLQVTREIGLRNAAS